MAPFCTLELNGYCCPDGLQASGSNCLFVWTAWDVLKAGSLCVSKGIYSPKRVYQFNEEKTTQMCLEPKSNTNEEMTKIAQLITLSS